ncbi:MAG: large conductance mechanosensitive channel protein MscL [Pseudomonadota bacterium]
MFGEFKKFIARGNVMDMAVGIIIGAAFTAIVNSMVGDLLMPVIGLVTAGVDFSAMFFALDGNEYANIAAAEEAGAAIMKYGLFINAIINFLIVAFVIFMLVRGVNSLKEKEAAKPAAPPADVKLLEEIRDLLKK